jgi:hypothetical protein
VLQHLLHMHVIVTDMLRLHISLAHSMYKAQSRDSYQNIRKDLQTERNTNYECETSSSCFQSYQKSSNNLTMESLHQSILRLGIILSPLKTEKLDTAV